MRARAAEDMPTVSGFARGRGSAAKAVEAARAKARLKARRCMGISSGVMLLYYRPRKGARHDVTPRVHPENRRGRPGDGGVRLSERAGRRGEAGPARDRGCAGASMAGELAGSAVWARRRDAEAGAAHHREAALA